MIRTIRRATTVVGIASSLTLLATSAAWATTQTEYTYCDFGQLGDADFRNTGPDVLGASAWAVYRDVHNDLSEGRKLQFVWNHNVDIRVEAQGDDHVAVYALRVEFDPAHILYLHNETCTADGDLAVGVLREAPPSPVTVQADVRGIVGGPPPVTLVIGAST